MKSSASLSGFAARLRDYILLNADAEDQFSQLALELFRLQFAHNQAYRRICEARKADCVNIRDWRDIPAVPTAAFKEFEMTCLHAAERTAVFHSSGTTGQRPSRHFHSADSLAVYDASLLPWFEAHLPPTPGIVSLTPPPEVARHSSLVHMFATVSRKFAPQDSAFCGRITSDGSWALDFDRVMAALDHAIRQDHAVALFGTAFNYVHLLDHLSATGRRLQLPAGSMVLETGGYKGRARSMEKDGLHSLLAGSTGVTTEAIVCEYGMSELSSQAYAEAGVFQFPPWARAQIISPETGREVADGETGLIRVFDLANVYSVMAIQTEDLGIRRGHGFELLGRAALSEPRGCSLMAV